MHEVYIKDNVDILCSLLPFQERYILSVADLISMDILLSVAPNVREAAASLMQGDHKSLFKYIISENSNNIFELSFCFLLVLKNCFGLKSFVQHAVIN